jgi:antitoxin CcdA
VIYLARYARILLAPSLPRATKSSNAHIMRIREEATMRAHPQSSARKRPVNLTLSEDLVIEARGLTDNLSGVVESLLSGYVEDARRQRLAKAKALGTTIAAWNEFTTHDISDRSELTKYDSRSAILAES